MPRIMDTTNESRTLIFCEIYGNYWSCNQELKCNALPGIAMPYSRLVLSYKRAIGLVFVSVQPNGRRRGKPQIS